YVPADDFTDPAVVHTFTHLSASIVLSRARAAQGLYPAIDPLASTSSLLSPVVVGARHTRVAGAVRATLAAYEDLKDIIAMLGLEELGEEDQRTVSRARRLERYLTQPFHVAEPFTGRKGASVPLDALLDDCEAILNDAYESVSEQSLYMIGTLPERAEAARGSCSRSRRASCSTPEPPRSRASPTAARSPSCPPTPTERCCCAPACSPT